MKAIVLVGHVLDRLHELPDESVQCVVTSPPYWGLRDYKVAGQLGLEATPMEYIDRMVDVFREVRRVLRRDGTLWLNIGDSYCSGGGAEAQGRNGLMSDRAVVRARLKGDLDPKRQSSAAGQPYRHVRSSKLKPKDMVGIPWMLAFALRADGWYLRQDIIWSKPNPMPEPVRDRCTKSHEYMFLLSKSEHYFYGLEAVKEAVSGNSHRRGTGVNPKCAGWAEGPGSHAAVDHARAVGAEASTKYRTASRPRQNSSFSGAVNDLVERRNLRSVWTIATQPYAEAHFATFPEALVEPCILAGSKVEDVVLDPFTGSGTTLAVALRYQRNAIGIELSQPYSELIRRRVGAEGPLLHLVEIVPAGERYIPEPIVS